MKHKLCEVGEVCCAARISRKFVSKNFKVLCWFWIKYLELQFMSYIVIKIRRFSSQIVGYLWICRLYYGSQHPALNFLFGPITFLRVFKLLQKSSTGVTFDVPPSVYLWCFWALLPVSSFQKSDSPTPRRRWKQRSGHGLFFHPMLDCQPCLYGRLFSMFCVQHVNTFPSFKD